MHARITYGSNGEANGDSKIEVSGASGIATAIIWARLSATEVADRSLHHHPVRLVLGYAGAPAREVHS